MAKTGKNLAPSDCHRHVVGRTGQALRYDGGQVGRWQRRLRRKLRQLLGLMPSERPPLRPRSVWRREHRLGTIEKVVFTSEPGADVPAYVCLPANASPPYAFMICLQGHGDGMHWSIGLERDERRTTKLEGDREFALGCMARGVAALCIEQRAFGQREEPRRVGHRCHDVMMRALLLGRTLPGERVFDVDRAIDYLVARGDADTKRLGLMGISGGGMVTICAAGLLPRVRLAVPIAHFCSYRDGLMSVHHCGCCYVPGILPYAEMADVMGLFAPRPVIVVTGRKDASKPIGGVRKAFRDLKRIYRAAGAEARCHLVVGPGGHRFYADRAWPLTLAELKKLQTRR